MIEEHSPVAFCEWLKRRRKALDMTQDELAQRAGCSASALRKIESGERRPSKQLAELLAKALEITEDDLPTFIRVARGELNIERLRQPDSESLPALSEIWSMPQAESGAAPVTSVKPSRSASHIPLQTTSLVGRETELAALEKRFNDPQCRLLTLTGIGGIGKTRLAIEFATRKQAGFPGGVFYIPLAPVNSPEKIVPTIADVLEVGFSGPNDPQEQLFNYIAREITQNALFVFDNLEHLLVPISPQDDKIGVVALVAEMLHRLPYVKILGTSRERLNLQGEWTYELHGLSVPSTDYIGSLEEYDAITLFLGIAQRVKADFQITLAEQLPLVHICQLVEGVPLAIELAAAWVSVLSCEEIAQEIKANLDFLTSSMHDIPERHRSIRATFDHSWKLLSDEEREVLCQLSVFRGGFDRQAAHQIAAASLPILASLSAKSLVRRTEGGRYDLHEVIRQYAFAHLSQHACKPDTHKRHGEYYLTLLKSHEGLLKSASQQEAMRDLTVEIDNIRSAWEWAIEHEMFNLLGEAGRAFGWYFEIAGLYREGIDQLERLVRSVQSSSQASQWERVLGLALLHEALLYFRKGEFQHAQKLYEESIAVLRPTGDQNLLMDALIFLGILLHLSGEYGRAEIMVEEGLVYARYNKDLWFEAYAINNLGYITSLKGNYQEGYKQMLDSLEKWRKVGDPHYIALCLNFMVPTQIQLGHYEEAKASMQESIQLCEQSKNRWGLGTAYRYLGWACLGAGQFTEAKAHLLKSLEIFHEFSEGWDHARTLNYLGEATRLEGDPAEARKIYQQTLQASLEAQSIPIALDAFLGISHLEAQAGEKENALVLCSYILNHPASEGETRSRAEQLRNTLERQLNPEQVEAARSQAAEKDFEWMVRLAQGGG